MVPTTTIPSSAERSTDGTESVGVSAIPDDYAENVVAYRETDEGKKLVGWILEQFTKTKSERSIFDERWRLNLNTYRNSIRLPGAAQMLDPRSNKLAATRQRKQRRINRIRSFVRTEHSKFISQEPTVTVVPSSSEESDFRAASSGEQAYRSMSTAGNLEGHMADATFWTVVTGNGFLKTYWDATTKDPVSHELGCVRYGSVTPFHLFFPDLRETSIEDQPFVIHAYEKDVSWARNQWPEELKNVSPSEMGAVDKPAGIPDTEVQPKSDTVYVLEVWVKPGATKLLPQGGLAHVVGNVLVGVSRKGIPYEHGLYPYTHIPHIPTGIFYRDSPVDDLLALSHEYNELRTDIARAARLMGRPQLIAERGSIVSAKMTNETGLVIEVNPGFRPPMPLQLPELPSYLVTQQDRVLQDFEDVSGQHEVSRGQAPGAGVTAGTAIAYLQESDDQYLTPQYRGLERAYEKIAKQSLELFVEFVPLPRAVRSIGADRAFDTSLLSGADLRNGTDVRVEKGSTISTSQVARRAEIKEMVGMGMLPPEKGLEMLEMGGVERLRETLDIARAKAGRENIKMKSLQIPDILDRQDAAVEHALQQLTPEQQFEYVGPELTQNGTVPISPDEVDPEQLLTMVQEKLRADMPPIIAVDDFDVHDVHIESHNNYRMGQEYETLPDEVKGQFELHIAEHQRLAEEAMTKQFLSQIPSDGTDGSPDAPAPDFGQIDKEGQPEQVEFGAAPVEQKQMEDNGDAQGVVNPTRAQMLRSGVAPQTPGL